jgi:kinesin family member 16B
MASVKVAVRVRPFNEREISLDSKCIIRMDGNKTIINNLKLNDITNNLQNEQQIINASEKFKEFVYDASYWSFDSDDPHFVSQQAVYNDLGKMTVNNAFDGYNACLCAYGQTGSGKSYSMMGQPSNLEQEGLIPRICKELFERIQSKTNSSNASSNVSYRTEVSYLEIYNEKVRDLLRTSQKNQQGQHNLKVREHPKTGVYVQDLSQHIVCNYDDIEELINKGNLNRTTASTNMNDVSSRSHAIFTVKFAQVFFMFYIFRL